MSSSPFLSTRGVAAQGTAVTAAASTAAGPWLTCAPLRSTERAGCCSAPPVVEASIPRRDGSGGSEQLLLCSHHFGERRPSLRAAGAVVFDTDGCLIMPRSWEAD